MPRYEYKLVPAPERSLKHKGLKGAALFAATLEDVMNAMGAEGWQYLRAETLPEEVRTGLTSRTTTYRNILIFRRDLPEDTPAPPPRQSPRLRQPAADAPEDQDEDDGDDEAGVPALANLFADPEDLAPDPDPPQPPKGPRRTS